MAAVALVTGANKGIGYQSALRLGALGMTVLVGARDESRGTAAAVALRAAGVDARFVELDVTDVESVKAAAVWITETFGRLDVLVNNAGVLLDGDTPVTDVTAEQLRRTYETNVFGVVTVTNAMIPLLRAAPAARVVNLSSGLGSLTVNAEQFRRLADYQLLAYGSSKSAVNSVTIFYANALRADGIKVNAAEPGFVATDLNGHRGTGTAAQGAEIVVRLATMDDEGPTGTFQSESGVLPW
jgi:NAD(P)-dependent dehydrogenase (short-subunit alcohol dehydrogenase family)